MKKIILLSLFLFGCTANPEYYSHSQKITLEGITPHTTVLYQNTDLQSEAQKEKKLFSSSEVNLDQENYVISRSWDDQELIIKKVGFEDYHLKLDSVMTSEAWASAEYLDGERHYFPLLGLLFPIKTAKAVVSVPYYLLKSVLSLITISPIGFTENIVQTGKSVVEIPVALAYDIYDIVGVPGTVIINPWTEFQYDQVVILKPTEALKNECASHRNTFISNNGCVECSDVRVVLYASQEECSKCPNRIWDNGMCQLK